MSRDPGPKRINKLVLVDQAILESNQAEEQIALGNAAKLRGTERVSPQAAPNPSDDLLSFVQPSIRNTATARKESSRKPAEQSTAFVCHGCRKLGGGLREETARRTCSHPFLSTSGRPAVPIIFPPTPFLSAFVLGLVEASQRHR